jgi:hypothetical protein
MENLLLKTGFDNLENNDSNQEVQLQMVALLTVFMENAMKTAEIYTKEANRKVITSQDISLSLKRELFTFLDNDDIEIRSLEILNEFKSELENHNETYDEGEYDDEDYEDDECEDEECNEYDEDNVEDECEQEGKKNNKEYDEEEFTICNSDCKICQEVNMYAEKWKTWQPTNNIEKILWSGINKIDEKFNLN